MLFGIRAYLSPVEKLIREFPLHAGFYCMIALVLVCACNINQQQDDVMKSDSSSREKNYIKPIAGKNDTLRAEDIQKGKVLIAYSDCHTCHADERRARGPAFTDIARRYPINEGYIELLAHKVRLGGSGAWGTPVMTPHPEITLEDARLMVMYILSLE